MDILSTYDDTGIDKGTNIFCLIQFYPPQNNVNVSIVAINDQFSFHSNPLIMLGNALTEKITRWFDRYLSFSLSHFRSLIQVLKASNN